MTTEVIRVIRVIVLFQRVVAPADSQSVVPLSFDLSESKDVRMSASADECRWRPPSLSRRWNGWASLEPESRL
jgi:hypothetical protein